MNKIIHSADKPSQKNKYQKYNQYFDQTKTFDVRAEKQIKRISRKYKYK